MADHDDLQHMVDEVLEPIWVRERRRARMRRLGGDLLRIAVLLLSVLALSAGFGLRRSVLELVFFGTLGALCVLTRESSDRPSRRRNRTRLAGT